MTEAASLISWQVQQGRAKKVTAAPFKGSYCFLCCQEAIILIVSHGQEQASITPAQKGGGHWAFAGGWTDLDGSQTGHLPSCNVLLLPVT